MLRRGFDQGDIVDAPPRQLRRDGNARRASGASAAMHELALGGILRH
ncbi:MAG: hypothetical protein RQ971_00530 [Armatimonadota bacterium]|nr:hypothetical protein [Armatimonadota bacterium]